MSESGDEQSKSEEATPFKLKKAREKGQVARGMDLSFAAGLIVLGSITTFAGHGFFVRLAWMMRHSFVSGTRGDGDANEALAFIGSVYWYSFQPIVLFGAMIAMVLIAVELLQLRGFIFTMHPLKPDFKRLNPAQGLKRLFSLRLLKETIKNVVKFVFYTTAAGIVGIVSLSEFGVQLTGAQQLAVASEVTALRLVFAFIGLALVFAAIDQVIVRSEFRKQMRMSRRELARETKDREGEPRLKQKRKDLHKQMSQQADQLAAVPGSDMVVVNPEHYAVALRYQPARDVAPVVQAKGYGHSALLLKRKASLHAVPIISSPALARALYADSQAGREISESHYRDVAKLYRNLRQRADHQPPQNSEVTV
ncbi:MAG: EscU/YscU/HrcU family type III secretion system export apparatus switch protein [Pseudomonadota bacterium]